ncbi:pro-epidermal growth factor-like isoform X2 [Zootermopsis nevadensis]|uniref:pro-epidermal growth factor-like isoform X2 n=1 Tax=Zootermopsis nevadensis TaxID=136037 RepID=UPI000B8E7025|nr:pro-epidermal growth factor-like isoform X2 [Zootermopsis nevadensis]
MSRCRAGLPKFLFPVGTSLTLPGLLFHYGHVSSIPGPSPQGRRRHLSDFPTGVGGVSACYPAPAEARTSRRATASPGGAHCRMPPPLATFVLVVSTVLSIADACSSRSTPKPRPPVPTARPNITFHTFPCPPAYNTWYCLNGATCFTVKIADSLLYNCECAEGFIGQRCEFKDLDGSYMPSKQRKMFQTASIAGGATIAVFLVVIVCVAVYIHLQRKQKETRASCVDGNSRDPERERRPFSRSLAIPMIHQSETACEPSAPKDLRGAPGLFHPTARVMPQHGSQQQQPPP